MDGIRSAKAIIQVEDCDVFLHEDNRDVGMYRGNGEQHDREGTPIVLNQLLPTTHYPLKDRQAALEFSVIHFSPI